MVAAKQDIGTGSSFNPVMGLYPGTVAQLGLSGGRFRVSIERADGVPLTVGSAGVHGAVAAAINKIAVPKVKGDGTIATIVRSALGKMASAANAYAAAHQPKASASSSGSAPGGHVTGGGRGAYAALRLGRTDQGVDFGGAGPVGAVLAGRVRSTGIWPGWPGTGGIVYSTAKGNVYIMEDFAPSVRAGTQLNPGDVIGSATGGSTGIETGWANTAGTGPLTPYNGAADGTPMPGGIAFKRFLGYALGGLLPFAGAFKNGGVVPGQIGAPAMALVHGGEVIHAATGHLFKNPASGPLAGSASLPFRQSSRLTRLLAELTAKIQWLTDQGAPNHSTDIAKLTDDAKLATREDQSSGRS